MKAWLARDSSGILFLYGARPYRDFKAGTGEWLSTSWCRLLPDGSYPQVKWEDDEPTEVEIEIKIKIKED